MLHALEMLRRKRGYQLPRSTTWLLGVMKRFYPVTIDTELLPGIYVRLDMRDDIQRAAFWMGAHYEEPTPRLLQELCGDGPALFFDIGSNFGYYAYAMLSARPQATVYSFEPNPRLAAQQQAARTASRLERRFFPHQLGLSDASGMLALHLARRDSGHSTFGRHPMADAYTAQVAVPVTSFDQWRLAAGLALPKTPSWLAKIDVEGFEPQVIRGMRAALTARAFKALCIEVNSFTLGFCGTTSSALYALLQESGYQAFDEALRPATPQPDELRNVFFLPAS